ncbi:hypothetical protein OS965_39870 [Streptomyces sp. H27-G5]|uniref:hypothetical protein n=1 Tax=Streptomyces sp. H27-G5 TaxID=2996698 RepID=UPI002271B4F0|nr:hypothetical protein [Streptomyces sp. H27-G5]MCY0924194.1 hypothetical protein [Streptomyces sp. H27-G5]
MSQRHHVAVRAVKPRLAPPGELAPHPAGQRAAVERALDFLSGDHQGGCGMPSASLATDPLFGCILTPVEARELLQHHGMDVGFVPDGEALSVKVTQARHTG